MTHRRSTKTYAPAFLFLAAMQWDPDFTLTLGDGIRRGERRGPEIIASGSPPQRPQFETVAIAGRVVDSETGKPLHGAVITVTPYDPAVPSRLIDERARRAETDEHGRYLLSGLPPGAYRLIARHAEYVDQMYGSKTDPFDGEVVRLAQHETRRGADFSLIRGATISGRVTDHHAKPVSNAYIVAIQTHGPFRYLPALVPETDTQGHYILRGLPEGTYRIRADWLDPAAITSGARLVYQQTYFPGAQDARDARSIRIGRGEHVAAIDIELTPSDLLSITGRVTNSTGEPVRGYLLWKNNSMRTVKVAADGTFHVPLLEAARYTLVVESGGGNRVSAATATIDLKTTVTDLTIALQPTVTIAGQVVTDDGSPVPRSLQIAAVLAVEGEAVDPLTRDRADITPADGSFVICGTFGERVFAIVGHADWRIDRIKRSSASVESIRTEPGIDVRDITIVLSRAR